MMAIADVFEALTATDRPYKQGKSADESLDIMRHMARGGHLDAELFELFAQSDIPARYASRFLAATQAVRPSKTGPVRLRPRQQAAAAIPLGRTISERQGAAC
jgi:hypothetical protein